MNRIIYKIVNGLCLANEWFQMAICLWFETINSDLERIKRGEEKNKGRSDYGPVQQMRVLR